MTPDKPKLCVECRHHFIDAHGDRVCRRDKKPTGLHLVTGLPKEEGNLWLCETERYEVPSLVIRPICGEEGRFWEKKEEPLFMPYAQVNRNACHDVIESRQGLKTTFNTREEAEAYIKLMSSVSPSAEDKS